MYCGKCGTANTPGAVFCEECGAKLRTAGQIRSRPAAVSGAADSAVKNQAARGQTPRLSAQTQSSGTHKPSSRPASEPAQKKSNGKKHRVFPAAAVIAVILVLGAGLIFLFCGRGAVSLDSAIDRYLTAVYTDYDAGKMLKTTHGKIAGVCNPEVVCQKHLGDVKSHGEASYCIYDSVLLGKDDAADIRASMKKAGLDPGADIYFIDAEIYFNKRFSGHDEIYAAKIGLKWYIVASDYIVVP